MTNKSNTAETKDVVGPRKVYLSQSDVPRHTLKDALRIAQALADNFGKAATKPLLVAQAIGLSPTSGTYRMLCGASIGYGLTEGGYNANTISLTSLGMRAVAPQSEGEDIAAMRDAFLRPRIINEFLQKYHNSKLPPEQIARNVLESMGVPSESSARVFEVIVKGAEELDLLREIKGQTYVDIESVASPVLNNDTAEELPSSMPSAVGTGGMVATLTSTQSPAMTVQQNHPGHRIFAIPLTGGRIGAIQLPISVDRSDLQRIQKWFEIMEDVLIEPAPTDSQNTMGSSPEAASLLSSRSANEQ